MFDNIPRAGCSPLRAPSSVHPQELATPLHYAAAYGSPENVKLLLSKGANKEARTDTGWSPLHSAAANRKTAHMQVLLQAGADKNSKTEVRRFTGAAAYYITRQ